MREKRAKARRLMPQVSSTFAALVSNVPSC
jgi:hypothetical protein